MASCAERRKTVSAKKTPPWAGLIPVRGGRDPDPPAEGGNPPTEGDQAVAVKDLPKKVVLPSGDTVETEQFINDVVQDKNWKAANTTEAERLSEMKRDLHGLVKALAEGAVKEKPSAPAEPTPSTAPAPPAPTVDVDGIINKAMEGVDLQDGDAELVGTITNVVSTAVGEVAKQEAAQRQAGEAALRKEMNARVTESSTLEGAKRRNDRNIADFRKDKELSDVEYSEFIDKLENLIGPTHGTFHRASDPKESVFEWNQDALDQAYTLAFHNRDVVNARAQGRDEGLSGRSESTEGAPVGPGGPSRGLSEAQTVREQLDMLGGMDEEAQRVALYNLPSDQRRVLEQEMLGDLLE